MAADSVLARAEGELQRLRDAPSENRPRLPCRSRSSTDGRTPREVLQEAARQLTDILGLLFTAMARVGSRRRGRADRIADERPVEDLEF